MPPLAVIDRESLCRRARDGRYVTRRDVARQEDDNATSNFEAVDPACWKRCGVGTERGTIYKGRSREKDRPYLPSTRAPALSDLRHSDEL